MQTLSAFIRRSRDAIVAEWLGRVRLLPSARGLSLPALLNHVPQILDKLADAIERGDTSSAALETLASEHAEERLQQQYGLDQVVTEYRILRRVILELHEEHLGSMALRSIPLIALNEVIDSAIADSVQSYTRERELARDLFVGILGHDLRTPLSALALNASQFRQRAAELPEWAPNLAARMAASAARMERMIDDLLDLARTRLGGGMALDSRPMDLRPVMAQAVGELATVHPERTIQCLATEVPGDFRGEWDADRIAQIISILVANAVRHGADPIVVEPQDRGEHVVIEVRSGGFIPAEAMPHLFKPLTTDSTASRDGLGLGLYIVSEVAKAHGGAVSAESENDVTRFRVALPRGLAKPMAGPA